MGGTGGAADLVRVDGVRVDRSRPGAGRAPGSRGRAEQSGPEPVYRYATPPPDSLSGGIEETSVAPPATLEELLARPSRVLVGTVTAEARGGTTQVAGVPDSTSTSRRLTVEVEQALLGPASALTLTEHGAYGPQGRRVVPGDRPRLEVGDRAVLLVVDVPHGPDVFTSFLLGGGHVVDTSRGPGAWPLRSALELDARGRAAHRPGGRARRRPMSLRRLQRQQEQDGPTGP